MGMARVDKRRTCFFSEELLLTFKEVRSFSALTGPPDPSALELYPHSRQEKFFCLDLVLTKGG